MPSKQGRNEVRWRPGQDIEESTCDTFGTFLRPPVVFRRPHSDLTPGELRPPSPLVTPLLQIKANGKDCK